ncbi:MAG TPA: Calx-beta domain-containing protein, partial [Pyrinomonadaceae bacterium]|nr:Calx-beta domain-containing protein [Pyrinomonadaceae bacterium]
MKNIRPALTRHMRLFVIIAACALVATLSGTHAFMQTNSEPSAQNPAQTSEATSISLKGMNSSEPEDATKDEANAQTIDPGPEAVTAASYPFTATTGVSLEDMSSGTTQLVAAGQDDTPSSVANIGFDYWYDGVRQTQFSVNANGLMRLGGTVVSNGFTNSLASTTDAPKIGAYWDDMCTGTNGKAHFKVTGSAPNRKLIVEWQNMQITRGAGCAGAGNGTFQIWLFETTGVIQFVYGSIQAANAVDGGYSVGLQSGASTNFASVTTTSNTVSYATANNTQTNAISAGTSYIFTPNVPNAPSGLNFTGTAAVTTTLNWTDTSSNEIGFVIYRSTDNVNFNFLTQTAANATSFTDNTVLPATQYFYRVQAVTEGALSSVLANNVTTNAAGNISSTAAGGPWSSTATWAGGVVPTVNDNVTIADGATVTIDTAAVAFTVTVGTGGTPATLQWDSTTARTLTVGTNVTIAANGVFQSATTGTVTTHTLSLGGNLTNNGVLDFSTNTNTAGAGITFTAATNNTFGGTGATTDLRSLTVNKGTDASSVIELTASNLTVQGVNTDVAGFLTITNGTLKISGTFTATNRVFTTAAYTIPATGGFWLNNPNFTVAGQNGSPTNNGLLRISQGTFNVGTSSGNAMGAGASASFIIEGGTTNFTGRLNTANAVTYTQTAGTVNVSTVGNASSLVASFGLTSTVSIFNMSGGTINLIQINSNATAANRLDYQVSSVANVTGGTLNVGTAATTGNAGNFDFRIRGNVPNLVIDNTTNAKNVLFTSQTNTLLNTTIPAGSTVNTQANIWLIIGDTVTNNGTITVPTSGARFYFLGNGTNAQTYAGNGTCTIVTASGSVDLTMDNPLGMTIAGPGTIITQRVNFFRGNITNSNRITLGNGGATVGVIQYGLTGGVNTAGNFDVAPVFNIGTAGQTILYAQEPTPRTTSVEIPPSRTILNATISNPNGGAVLAGGDLTFTGTLTFTAGNLTTNNNTVIIGGAGTVTRTSGHVIGNLNKVYTAAASKTFEVGTANGFSPVTVNSTAGTYPGDFTVKAIQGQMPQISGTNALQRYWTLSNNISGDVANLTFNYLATDVVGTAANYVFVKNNGGTLINNIPPASPPTTTQATINGVSSFSDWTLAESAAVQPGTFQFSSATYSDSETNSDHTFNAVVNRVGGSDGNVSVDFQVTDGTATAGSDYTIASSTGTLNWNAGDATSRNITITVKGDTTFEPDETVNFQLNNPQGGPTLGTPNSAVLTITNDDAPVSAGQLIISEFRLRGPNPNGAQNEFIEIYNNTGSPHTVGATDASAGYGVAASDGVLRCTIPNGTVIPARGHFLCVNSVGYSLSNYPAGNSPTSGGTPSTNIREAKHGRRALSSDSGASDDSGIETAGGSQSNLDGGTPTPEAPNATGDATYTTDIPDNAGIALFSSTTTFTLANRLDAVGSTSEANTLYKEGTGYPALTPFSIDYAFVRDMCGKGGSITTFGPCPQSGLPKDTDNNAADFIFVDTNGTSAGAGQRLGAPGPENLSSPIVRNSQFSGPTVDSTVGASSAPNRVRDFTSDPANNSTFGTLDIRKRIINNTGGNVTRLRFRIIDLSTFPAPSGIADLRPRTSTLVVVSGINDAATCLASNGVATTPCTVNVQGTTLEQPPS